MKIQYYKNMGQIDISHYVLKTKVLGPYLRSGLWLHGCCFSCNGCLAKKMNEQAPQSHDIVELANILGKEIDTEGITISGGEPFLQAKEVRELLSCVKRKRDYGVIIYSGFTFEELNQSDDTYAKELLKMTDILIDGRYIKELDDGKAYRGSSNQRIISLSQRYNDVLGYYSDNGNRNIEIQVTGKNVYMVGVPSEHGLETWRKFKKKAGCESD